MNKSLGDIGNAERTLMQFVYAAAVVLPYVLLRGELTTLNIGVLGWIALITVGIFHTGVAYLMYFSAVSNLSGAQVAIYSYIDPLVAVVLSVTVLGESLTVMQAIGGAAVLLSTLACELVPIITARRNQKLGEDDQRV
jgi:drug/metabolite transporter (DMT)-like permease